MTRAIILTSTAPRHKYFASVVEREFEVTACLTQPKKDYYLSQIQLSQSVREHFVRNSEAEFLEFGDSKTQCSPIVVDDINSDESIAHAHEADVALLFGTAILSDKWLSLLPGRIINLHLGLSPFYRGSATLFWPIFEQELACVGATIHLAEKRVDSGDILKRVRARPIVGDTYYSLTNRLIREAINSVPNALRGFLDGSIIPQKQERLESRAYKKQDFKEEALNRALSFFGGGLTLSQILDAKNCSRCDFSQ